MIEETEPSAIFNPVNTILVSFNVQVNSACWSTQIQFPSVTMLGLHIEGAAAIIGSFPSTFQDSVSMGEVPYDATAPYCGPHTLEIVSLSSPDVPTPDQAIFILNNDNSYTV